MEILLRSTIQVKDNNKQVFSDIFNSDYTATEYDVRKIDIVGGVIDEVIDLGGVSNCIFLRIICSQPMKFKVNDSPIDTSRGKEFLFTGIASDPITSLKVSNPNVDNVELRMITGG